MCTHWIGGYLQENLSQYFSQAALKFEISMFAHTETNKSAHFRF